MDGRDFPDGVHLGDVFAGRYRIEARLGGGAMGVVARAHHLVLDHAVALKFLHTEMAEQSGAVGRFLHEARAAARLRSKHAVRVLDAAVHDGIIPYIVMEYLSGRDLAQCLLDGGPFSPSAGVDCIRQAAEAIAEAHHAGIIHRDLKPANLFLADRADGPPLLKVLDFGIAKITSLFQMKVGASPASTKPSTTQTRGVILGSPYYMSPEQMESSGRVDARTDVWALGVTLYELITGQVPYPGTTLIEVYSKIVSAGSQKAWRERWPVDAPAGLDAVVAKCLQRNRDERYRSVDELGAALSFYGSDPPSPRTPLLAAAALSVEIDRRANESDSFARITSLPSLELRETLTSGPSRPFRPSRPFATARWWPPALAVALFVGFAMAAWRGTSHGLKAQVNDVPPAPVSSGAVTARAAEVPPDTTASSGAAVTALAMPSHELPMEALVSSSPRSDRRGGRASPRAPTVSGAATAREAVRSPDAALGAPSAEAPTPASTRAATSEPGADKPSRPTVDDSSYLQRMLAPRQ